MNIVKDFVLPTAILTVICVVAAGALVGVHGVTQPMIDRNTRGVAEAAMREVVGGADTFTLAVLTEAPAAVLAVNTADNGAGSAVEVQAKGYGADPLRLMVGIRGDGTLEKIAVVTSSETTGIGDKALTEESLARFAGTTAADYMSVDAVAGATVTSGALKVALGGAFDGHALATGGTVAAVPERGLTEALLAQHYPGITPEAVSEAPEDVEVLSCGDAGLIVTAEGRGFGPGPLRVAVLFDADGLILATAVTETSETVGIGDKVEGEDYAAQYVGQANAEGVSAIAGSTRSSEAYAAAVTRAAEVFAELRGA